MRVRHRIPSIFTLSMVDVLCCALGCVVLLWLLNAKQHEDTLDEQAHENEELLAAVRSEREASRAQLTDARGDRDRTAALLAAARSARDGALLWLADLNEQIADLQKSRNDLEKQLAARRAALAGLEAKLKASSGRVTALEADVKAASAKVTEERGRADGLGMKLAAAEKALTGLRADLAGARSAYADEQRRAKGLQDELGRGKKESAALGRKIDELTDARRELTAALALKDKELALARPYKERWETAEARLRKLEGQLKEREGAVVALKGEKTKLEADAARVRAAAEARFAGIPLTGKRVIFLVDASGSMEYVDEKTKSPPKWAEVRATVAKVMRSLPDLKQYQLITFAAKASFPLGKADSWLEYDAKKSPDEVVEALAAIKPAGGTNMYDALDAAFRYRGKGLDTVYLLSDGLPNAGPGLPAGLGKVSELERGTYLGKHVRKTLKASWNAADPKRPKVVINTIGFFYESPDLGAFLWALAREHEGSFVGMSKP